MSVFAGSSDHVLIDSITIVRYNNIGDSQHNENNNHSSIIHQTSIDRTCHIATVMSQS